MTDTAAEVRKILDANPELERVLRQFMALYDAAEVLEHLDPPRAAVAGYLRTVASATMDAAGIPGEFTQVMIAARPAVSP
jgi:beta-phosphoglucomutase-like phosphatase (HAD superfamily)